MLEKLIEKVSRERLQFQAILNNFIYSNQLGGLKQSSTTDVSNFLTYLICSGWIKGLLMSTLVFNIVHFFPLLNY